MKKILILLLAMLVLTNCRTRKKDLKITEFRNAQIEKIDTNTVVSTEKKQEVLQKISQKSDEKIKENSGEIIIKGKTDSLKPFTFHNVVDGDTLSAITISGIADFQFKNHWQNSEKHTETKKDSVKLNIIAEIARTAVAKSTIKKVAGKVKAVEKEVAEKGFSFITYLWFFGALIFVVILVFLWFYLKNLDFSKYFKK